MNNDEFLKQKNDTADKWRDISRELERVDKMMIEGCGYCKLYNQGLRSYCQTCPLYPELCSSCIDPESTHSEIIKLMSSLQTEVTKLRNGISCDIKETEQALYKTPPGDKLILGKEKIGRELKDQFPGIGFILLARYGDGFWGTGIRIKWFDGPTYKEVKKITGKYSQNPSSAQYVADHIILHRIISDELRNRVGQLLCDNWGMSYRGNEAMIKKVDLEGRITVEDYVMSHIDATSFGPNGVPLYL